MSKISGQCILLGVTGGIAAYKSADLVRRLVAQGAIVKVVMTDAAKQFISPLTLQAVSGNPVHDKLFDHDAEAAMGHIELARWPDLVIVAPATASFIARLAVGLADDLLSTICLATNAQLKIAPAMNRAMWGNLATQENIEKIRGRNVEILGPDIGEQACGEFGLGRMIEPDTLVRLITHSSQNLLSGINVLITSGPTWEMLDPVRIITNQSSGKMGHAVASAANCAGAKVTLITGPTLLSTPTGIQTHRVTSALEMLNKVEEEVSDADIFIAVAAVSDYRPKQVLPRKLKKHAATMTIELIRNPDILSTVASSDSSPFTVGFAAETDNVIEEARKKIKLKNIDVIVVNRVGTHDCPFGKDDNQLTLIDRETELEMGRDSKTALAQHLISEISSRYHAKHSNSNS